MEAKVKRQQETFRTLLNCMARPGKMAQLHSYQTYGTSFYDATVEALLTVLDAEVQWYAPDIDAATREEIEIRTLTRFNDVAEADYIVLRPGEGEEDFRQVMMQAKIGTEINPHESATIFIEVDNLEAGKVWELTGPGIKSSLNRAIPGSENWMSLRKACIHYPCGWDMFIIDQQGRVIALPRTTLCKEVE